MTPTHAERSRTLVEHAPMGALSTLSEDGEPYGSLVQLAPDADGQPLFLLSTLAEHTRNFLKDPRASLLVWEKAEDPLQAGRVTLMGRVDTYPDGRDRYLERVPSSKKFAGFKDFAIYRLRVEKARYVGGFGDMSWVQGKDYALAEPDPIAPLGPGILQHMNEDHLDAIQLLAGEKEGWTMTAVDRFGYVLEKGSERKRISFATPVKNSEEVRREMVAQVRAARK